MRVVGLHIDARAQNGDTAVVMAGGIIDQSLVMARAWCQSSVARFGIQRVRAVGAGNEHDARDDDGVTSSAPTFLRYEDPLRAQMANVGA